MLRFQKGSAQILSRRRPYLYADPDAASSRRRTTLNADSDAASSNVVNAASNPEANAASDAAINNRSHRLPQQPIGIESDTKEQIFANQTRETVARSDYLLKRSSVAT